jgi:hypothetical protein
MLRYHFARRIHQRAGGILRFAHDRREAGAEQRVLHFLDNAGKACPDDFEFDRVDVLHQLFYTNDQPILPVIARLDRAIQ